MCLDLGGVCAAGQFDGHANCVAVLHRNAVCVGAHGHCRVLNVIRLVQAEELDELGLHFRLFVLDVRDHVAEDVH
ncbi:hypothetical protein D3C83_241560 [compost metagenome]